jgi:hypothetical protein
MKDLMRRRPSPAMVVALIALFVALGGVSYGLATGSVNSREILNNTVRSVDLRNNNATGTDLRNDSLTGSDILESSLDQVPSAANVADGAITTQKLAAGAVTSAKIDAAAVTAGKIAANAVQSSEIDTAAVGAAELKDTYIFVGPGAGTAGGAGTYVTATVTCAGSDIVLSGGPSWQNPSTNLNLMNSVPNGPAPGGVGDNPQQWIVTGSSAAANTLFAWAVCQRN